MSSYLDLTQRAPRSPRVRIGGYVLLARCLDKGRASLAGKNGEYNYDCPLDKRLLDFIGVSGDALKEQLAAGKGDGEILQWIRENGNKHSPAEIAAWSALEEQRAPTDVETRAFFNELHKKAAPARTDVSSWFDLLDLDDYVTFGGKA